MPDSSATATPDPISPERFDPVAAVLAAILPGAGHVYLGQKKRGLMIGVGVLGLFFGGLFIGGIDAVDKREDFIWFLGQGLVGPVAFAVDHVHQTRFKGVDESGRLRTVGPNERRDANGRIVLVSPGGPPNVKSVGRMNELGTLYATIAGMLNLIAFLDAALHRSAKSAA